MGTTTFSHDVMRATFASPERKRGVPYFFALFHPIALGLSHWTLGTRPCKPKGAEMAVAMIARIARGRIGRNWVGYRFSGGGTSRDFTVRR